jgi:hypothetical protein
MSTNTRGGIAAAAAVLVAIACWLAMRRETSGVATYEHDAQDRIEASPSTPTSGVQRTGAFTQASTTRRPQPPKAMATTRSASDREQAVDAPSAGSGSEEASGAERAANADDDLTASDIDRAWEEEEPNAELSRAIEEAALANFAADEIDPNVLLAVDCRESVCRFELDPANGLALVKLANRADKDGVRGKRAFVSRPDGSQVVAFYLANDKLGSQD